MRNAYSRAKHYKRIDIETATPGQLLIALYDAAIRYAKQGAESIRKGNIPEKAKELQRVAAIITELTSTLNREVAPELCENLEQLYFYMQEQIATANAMMDPSPAEEVAGLLNTLREAWAEAVIIAERTPRIQRSQACAIG